MAMDHLVDVDTALAGPRHYHVANPAHSAAPAQPSSHSASRHTTNGEALPDYPTTAGTVASGEPLSPDQLYARLLLAAAALSSPCG